MHRSEVIVNGVRKRVSSTSLSYADIVKLAYGDRKTNTLYTITYSKGITESGIITPGKLVGVLSGMIFNVAYTGNA